MVALCVDVALSVCEGFVSCERSNRLKKQTGPARIEPDLFWFILDCSESRILLQALLDRFLAHFAFQRNRRVFGANFDRADDVNQRREFLLLAGDQGELFSG